MINLIRFGIGHDLNLMKSYTTSSYSLISQGIKSSIWRSLITDLLHIWSTRRRQASLEPLPRDGPPEAAVMLSQPWHPAGETLLASLRDRGATASASAAEHDEPTL